MSIINNWFDFKYMIKFIKDYFIKNKLMSLFWINKWHIETSLDMLNAWDTPEKIEKQTREKLEDIKKWVEKELSEKKYSTKEYEDLLNKWLEAYKSKIQKDTRDKVAKVKVNVGWNTWEWSKPNTPTPTDKEKPANEKPIEVFFEINDREFIIVNNYNLKKWDKIAYNSNENWVFTWKYKKVWDKITEIEIEKNWTKWDKIYIKVWDIISIWEKPEENKNEVEKETWNSNPMLPTFPRTERKEFKQENINTRTIINEISSLYKTFLETAKSIDSFWDLKTKKQKNDSKIILITNYNNLIYKINELLLSWKATKENIDYVNKLKITLANYFAWNLTIENEHWKDYDISSQISLSILSSIKKPPQRPDFLKVLSRLKWTWVSDYIAQELAKWTPEKTIFENKLVKDKTEEESKKLASEYEKELKKYLDSFDQKTLTDEQKKAIALLREIEWTNWWKKSTWDGIKLWWIDIWVIVAWIYAWAQVWSVWFVPWIITWAIVWWTVATAWMMLNHGDNYFMEHWSVWWKELWINIWTFWVWWATIKIWNRILRIAEEWTKAAKYSRLAWVTAWEAVIDVNIWAVSDYLRNDWNVSYADAVHNNLIWALLPIFLRWHDFWKIRKDFANKTLESYNRQRMASAVWRDDIAKQMEKQTDDNIRAMRKTEDSQNSSPEKPKGTENTTNNTSSNTNVYWETVPPVNTSWNILRNIDTNNYHWTLSFFQKTRANELIFKELDNWKTVNIWWENYTKIKTTKWETFFKDSKWNEITKTKLKSKITESDQKTTLIRNSEESLKEIKQWTKWELWEIKIDKNTKVRADWTVMIKDWDWFRLATKEESNSILNNPTIASKILNKAFPTFSSDVLTMRQEILKKISDTKMWELDVKFRKWLKESAWWYNPLQFYRPISWSSKYKCFSSKTTRYFFICK